MTRDRNPKILPWLSEAYFGQRAILEHLTLLISWAGQEDEELPALLFTGVHGQGQRVLAKLIAENCELEYLDLELHEDTTSETLERALAPIQGAQKRTLPYIEIAPGFPLWRQLLDSLMRRRPTHLSRPTKLTDLILRVQHPDQVPVDPRRAMGAHFHFGPNEDEGEFALQKWLADEKGYAFDDDALDKIVDIAGGSDALGERLLDLSWRRTRSAGKPSVTAQDVEDTWNRLGNHLKNLVDLPTRL